METFMSKLRYISLLVLIIVVVGNMWADLDLPPWLGLIYPMVILVSWVKYILFMKKYNHKGGDFIGSLIMEDIVTPLGCFWDVARSTRIWNIWHFRKRKYGKQSFKEKLVAWVLRIAIILIVLMVMFVITSLLAA